jgi:iduronate 2-sulfatase
MLADPQQTGRNWAITQVVRRRKGERFFGYSLRTPRWRYTEWDEGREGRELYDHEADPRELKNLAEDPSVAAERTRLAGLMQKAVQTTLPESGTIPPVKTDGWDIILQP